MAWSEEEMENCYLAAIEAAKRAGKVAIAGFTRDKAVETKSGSADLVTETDRQVEQLIFSFLREQFPDHKYIGEESVDEKGVELTDSPTWMIDPIDGTTNFVHQYPMTCISIGLTVKKEAIVGVVYNFVSDKLYAAKKGGGATLNGQPIHVSECREKTQSLVVTELGNQRSEHLIQPKLDTLLQLTKDPNPIHGIRMVGSAALNMCTVATGEADAYYEYGIHCWDIAAGDIIVREAGGVTILPHGEPLDLMKRGILCSSSQQLSSQLVPAMQLIHYSTSQTN